MRLSQHDITKALYSVFPPKTRTFIALGVLCLTLILPISFILPRQIYPIPRNETKNSVGLEEACNTLAQDEVWFNLMKGANKVGYYAEKISHLDGEPAHVFTFESLAATHVDYAQHPYTCSIIKRLRVDLETLTTLSFRVERRDGNLLTSYEGTLENNSLHLRTQTPTLKKEDVLPVKDFMPEQLARILLINGAFPSRTYEYEDFDSNSGILTFKRLQAFPAIKNDRCPDGASWWLRLSNQKDSEDDQDMFLDAQAKLIGAVYKGDMQIKPTTRTDATNEITEPFDLHKQGKIPTNASIPHPEKTTDLHLKINLPEWRRFPLQLTGDITPDADPNTFQLAIPPAPASVDRPNSDSPSPHNAQSHDIKPTLYVESDDPVISDTAKKLVGDATDVEEQCRRLTHSCGKLIYRDNGIQGLGSAKTALQSQAGDCTERAFLFAALAHNLKIPTRLCVGVVYREKEFRYHAWNKALLHDEWVTIDTGFDQFVVDATHIQLWEGGYSPQEITVMLSLLQQIYGRLQIEILSFNDAPAN